MSRFEYDGDEEYPGAWALWQRSIENALTGRKALAFLRELEAALLALPEPRLIEGRLAREDGCVCAMGAWAKARLDRGETLKPAGTPALGHPQLIRTWEDLLQEAEWGAGEEFWTTEFGVENGILRTLAYAAAWENDEGASIRGEGADERRYQHVLAWTRRMISANRHSRKKARS